MPQPRRVPADLLPKLFRRAQRGKEFGNVRDLENGRRDAGERPSLSVRALEAFFEAVSFESAIRNAVSIGGDSDTIAAIAGAVAGARWGVPDNLRAEALARLDEFQRETIEKFEKRFS